MSPVYTNHRNRAALRRVTPNREGFPDRGRREPEICRGEGTPRGIGHRGRAAMLARFVFGALYLGESAEEVAGPSVGGVGASTHS